MRFSELRLKRLYFIEMDEPVINERERAHAGELVKEKAPIREWRFRANALLTFAFNATSSTVPDGERFIVRTADEARKLINDEQLKKNAETLIHEETAHARMHDAYNRYLDSLGFPATKHSEETKKLLMFFEKRFSLKMRLVTCTIIEHFTVTYSKQVLDIGVLEGEDVDERMDRVWSWHCIEEMEHRSTALDLYRGIGGGDWVGGFIGAFGSGVFALCHYRGLLGLLCT